MVKKSVAVLGATGLVGQHLVRLLQDHPWFDLSVLASSPRCVGKKYGDVIEWRVDEFNPPDEVLEMTVYPVNPSEIKKVDNTVSIVFSALPAEVAKEVEPKFAKEGFIISSNASPFRLDVDVPLVVPEVNPDHLKLLEVQREKRGWPGGIVKNPNCSTIQLVLTLKPLMDRFGMESVFVSTMQAVSGAGYPGVSSIAIIDNIIPYIAREEEKMETETLKILGKLEGERVKKANFSVAASCHRVPTVNAHLEAVFVKLSREASLEEVKETLKGFKGLPQKLALPTAPLNPIIVREEPDRPQPRKDRMSGVPERARGMAVVVGRIRRSRNLDEKWIKYLVLGHNLIRGAAGAALLNAELLVAKGLVA